MDFHKDSLDNCVHLQQFSGGFYVTGDFLVFSLWFMVFSFLVLRRDD
jgi:hypothetical protein